MQTVLTEAQLHEISEHYIALLLSLLGVVQGLALNHLADKIIIFGKTGEKSARNLRIAVYAMCFFIIVRVFQTYSSAAFERSQQHFDVIDLSSIFAVGLLQYWVIDAIQDTGADASGVFFRVIFLALAAAVLHFITGFNIFRGAGPEIKEKLHLQAFNITVACSIALIAFVNTRTNSARVQFISAIIIAIFLVVNIEVSLYWTKLL